MGRLLAKLEDSLVTMPLTPEGLARHLMYHRPSGRSVTLDSIEKRCRSEAEYYGLDEQRTVREMCVLACIENKKASALRTNFASSFREVDSEMGNRLKVI